MTNTEKPLSPEESLKEIAEAEAILQSLASVFFPDEQTVLHWLGETKSSKELTSVAPEESINLESRYRTLLEQIPAVVFMASLDKGFGDAYVSPYIEETLGFKQAEWLNDPVRWYRQIHPDDKRRWSVEAAEMFLTGKSLRSIYRVIARDGHVVWFHCEAKMVRTEDGRPWFIHGVGFDISDLKQAEESLKTAHAELARVNQALTIENAERKRAEAAEREYSQQLQTLSRRLMEVQETERRNISKELQISFGPALIELKMLLEQSQQLPPEQLANKILQAQNVVNDLLARSRKMALDLRPTMLDEEGLIPALLWFFEQYTMRTFIHINFDHSGIVGARFNHEIETAVYRIIQEALTNISLHAKADEAGVQIRAATDKLTIEIADSGIGFDATTLLSSNRLSGISEMRERAKIVGGKFNLESKPGKGTRIISEWTLME